MNGFSQADLTHSRDHTQFAVRVLNIICFIWSILSVELTLKWNNISNVHDIKSTGQLIPFVIGIVSLLSLLQGISVRNSDVRAYDAIMVSSA